MDALSLFHRYRDDVYRLAVIYTCLLYTSDAADECRSLLRSGGWKRTVKALFFAPRTGTPRQDILRLPPKYRVVMYLRYYEDFTTGEIARLLKIPQSTAAARLSRGRGLLERQLRKGAA